MAQSSHDYLWLSSAKEGLACTMVLMTFLHADVGVSLEEKKKINITLTEYPAFFTAYCVKTDTYERRRCSG